MMLSKFKKDNEKIAMGFLSYLPDFKNLQNLKDEMKLYEPDSEFVMYMFKLTNSNIIGVLSLQKGKGYVLIRYISLAPGYRSEKYIKKLLEDVINEYPNDILMTLPQYTYLLKLLKND